MEVDINLNNILGCVNSELLYHYCKISPVFHKLCYYIKQWKYTRITNKQDRVSSYCMIMLLLGFMLNKGYLPNL